MPDCISNASSMVVTLSWVSLILMVLGLGFGVKTSFPRKKLSPLLLLVFAHPILWSRGSGDCETPLWKTSALFTGLALLVFIWAYFHTEIAESLEE